MAIKERVAIFKIAKRKTGTRSKKYVEKNSNDKANIHNVSCSQKAMWGGYSFFFTKAKNWMSFDEDKTEPIQPYSGIQKKGRQTAEEKLMGDKGMSKQGLKAQMSSFK